jgi:hypothetical protein
MNMTANLGRTRRWLLCATALIGLLLLLIAAAPAARAGQYEPNDEIGVATGPIGPQPYGAEFETDQDEDWYWIPLGGQQQIDLAVYFADFHCSYGARAYLVDSQGETIEGLYAISQDYSDEGGDEVQHFLYTTPPAGGVYFLRFTGVGPPCPYEFEVGPGSVFAAGLANPVIRNVEPDDVESSAHGPLVADTLYSGAIDAEGDVDQLYMDALPGTEIQMTLIGYCHERGGVDATITGPAEGPRYNELETSDGYGHGSTSYETGPGGRVYVAVNGEAGCHWQFRVTPGSALGIAPPAPVEAAVDRCARAKHHLRRRQRAVKRLSKALHRARSPRARGRLHHRVEVARRAVRATRHLVAVRCS